MLDTVDRGEAIRRRRACERCGHRWTTFEQAEVDILDRAAIGEHLAALQAIVARE